MVKRCIYDGCNKCRYMRLSFIAVKRDFCAVFYV